MINLELTPRETVVLYSLVQATLETMKFQDLSDLAQPDLTQQDLNSLKKKMKDLLDKSFKNN
jgi:hypothetical protein